MDLGLLNNVLLFVALGALGGFTYILMEKAEKWADLVTFFAFKRYVLGAIVGYLYNMGYSTWSFPDGLMCFVSGYAGTTFIQSLVSRYEDRQASSTASIEANP